MPFPARQLWSFFTERMFPGLRRRGGRPGSGRTTHASCRPRLEQLEDRLAPAVYRVGTEFATLEAAIVKAVNDDQVNDTILLAPGQYDAHDVLIQNKVTLLDGDGHVQTKSLTILGEPGVVTITAGGLGRVFSIIDHPGQSPLDLRLQNLTITGGLVQGVMASEPAIGGGLLIDGGKVTLSDVTIDNNQVIGENSATGNGQSAYGGGIYMTSGTLTMNHVSMTNNVVKGGVGGTDSATSSGANGGDALGGGFYVKAGTVVGENCFITDNKVFGGRGGDGDAGAGGWGGTGGSGMGGGFYEGNAKVTFFAVVVQENLARGGAGGNKGDGRPANYVNALGGDGGCAYGGGCYVASGGQLDLVSIPYSTTSPFFVFWHDQAIGGDGGLGGNGAGYISVYGDGQSGGTGGWGGWAYGGAIYQAGGTINIYGGAISKCIAQGGIGGSGGNGVDGQDLFHGYPGEGWGVGGDGGAGGDGGPGGSANGGAIYCTAGLLSLYQAAVINNSAIGGAGGIGQNGGNGAKPFTGEYVSGGSGARGGAGGNGGDAKGGGIFVDSGELTLVAPTVAGDLAQGGAGGGAGNGGDGHDGATLTSVDFFGVYQDGTYGGLAGGGGRGGRGGDALGGALHAGGYSGIYSYAGTISGLAQGGTGHVSGDAGIAGNGGNGSGSHQGAPGGSGGNANGGDGGEAHGGGVYLDQDVIQATIDGTLIGGEAHGGNFGDAGLATNAGSPGANWFNDGTWYFLPVDGVRTPGHAGVASDDHIDNLAGITIQNHQPATATVLTFSPLPSLIFGGAKFPYPVYVIARDDQFRVAGDFGLAGPSFDKFVDLTDNWAGNDFVNRGLGGAPRAPLVNGVAVFTNLSDNHPVNLYKLMATCDQLPSSVPFANVFQSSQFTLMGYTPDQIRQAYGIDKLGNDANGHPLDGTGQTIAIVGPPNPNLFSDVNAFIRQFGLTSYGTAESFLTVVNQDGGSELPTETSPRAAGETALDVQWAHAIAPGAKIVVLEVAIPYLDPFDIFADARGFVKNVMTAARTGASLPNVSVVSMSIGWNETRSFIDTLTHGLVTAEDEADFDSNYLVIPSGHQGVTFVAATGDQQLSDSSYPAFSPKVLAAGGTTLFLKPDGSWSTEVGWSNPNGPGTGGGPSQFEAEPAYQLGLVSGGKRAMPDVSFLADGRTAVAVYDSFNQSASFPWSLQGGTSLSTPCWAGLIAIVNQGRQAAGRPVLNTASASGPNTLEAIYQIGKTKQAQDFHDITSGTISGTVDGKAVSYSAGTGYDMVSGWGTPKVQALIPDLINYGDLRITPTSVPAATIKTHFHQVITATNDTGSVTLKSSIASGTTIFGLTFTIHNGNPATLTIDGTPNTAGAIHFTLEASDGAGHSAGPISYTLTINGPPITLGKLSTTAWTQNHPGYVGTIAIGGGAEHYSFQVSGLPDPDHVKWSFDPKTKLITIKGTPMVAGPFDVSVTVTDTAGTVKNGTYRLTINSPPKLGSLTPSDWTRGRAYTGTIQIVGGTPRYKGSSVVITGLPPGLAWTGFDTRTGVITIKGTPKFSGTYKIRVGVDDQVGAHAAAGYRFTVHAPITLSKLSRTTWTQNQPGYAGVIRIAGGTGPYTVQATGVPAGLMTTIDPITGVVTLSGMPTQAVHATIGITVKDISGDAETGKYNLNINSPITLGALSSTIWTMGHAYTGTIQVKGGTGPYVGGSLVVNGLPVGLSVSSFDSTKGVITITGTPVEAVATANNVSVTVQDQVGATGTSTYTLVINPPVSLSPISAGQGIVGADYNLSITGSAGTGIKTMHAVIVGGTLPTGLTITAADGDPGTVTIAGTPTKSGTVVVNVTATDGVGASAGQNYIVTILPSGGLVDAPKITSISPAAGLTTGGTTVTITGTNLLGAVGVLFGDKLVTHFVSTSNTTWVLTTPPGAAGTVDVRVITGIGTSYPVSFQYVPPPVFQPAALPAGAVGVAYNKTISVSGSEIWQLSYQVIGPVPKGLKISQSTLGGNIVISGKPAAAGSFKIKVTAKDALGVIVVRTYTVTIS